MTRNDNTLNVVLNKVLDCHNSKEVTEQIKSRLDEKVEKIVFDASNHKYISADGLVVILEIWYTCRKCREIRVFD